MRPRLLRRSTPDYWAVAIVWPRGTVRALLADAWKALQATGPVIAQVITIGGTLAAIRWLPKFLGL